MTVTGGNIESRKVDVVISPDDEFVNIEIVDDVAQIQKVNVDSNVLYSEGYWISNSIDTSGDYDNFGSIDTNLLPQGTSIQFFTQVSDDDIAYDEWISVGENNKILSDKKKYIRIKSVFYSAKDDFITVISQLNYINEKINFNNSEWINTSDGLKLENSYNIDLEKIIEWSNGKKVHKKDITKDYFLRLDSLSLTGVLYILHDGEYIVWNGNEWLIVTDDFVNENIDSGMVSTTNLSRKEMVVSNNQMLDVTGEYTTNEDVKIFSTKVNLQNIIDVKRVDLIK